LSDINKTFNFIESFFPKNTQISHSMTIRPVGGELLHEYKRTDGHNKANIRFLKFCGSA
jgi:hypothetical protein